MLILTLMHSGCARTSYKRRQTTRDAGAQLVRIQVEGVKILLAIFSSPFLRRRRQNSNVSCGKMNFLQFLLHIPIVFLYSVFIIAIDIRPDIDKYCRERERLATSAEIDEYLLVDAQVNTTIILNCHFWLVLFSLENPFLGLNLYYLREIF